MTQDILQKIKEAEMVLVGIGEEFDDERLLRTEEFQRIRRGLEQEAPWAIPAWNRYWLEHSESNVPKALRQLAKCLENKNYFVVATATNDFIWDCGLNEERVVAPCGGGRKKQCPNGCPEGLQPVAAEEMRKIYEKLAEGRTDLDVGCCPACGHRLILNNIYTESYDEKGYLEQWQKYTKWLQGTLFHKLCILELGVGMQCPSVIRFPFEKTGYFNQKSSFIRVNERLYQLAEEIGERGISVPQNAVDWLQNISKN